MIEMVASDVGYQNYLLQSMQDKLLFNQCLFHDIGFLITMVEKLGERDGVLEVGYDGSTSTFSIQLDPEKIPTIQAANDYVRNELVFIISSLLMLPDGRLTEFGSDLIAAKMGNTPEYLAVYRWLREYQYDPYIFNTFFKVFCFDRVNVMVTFN